MPTVREIQPQVLVAALKKELKKLPIQPHPSCLLVKSGVSRERPPLQEDFWFIRSASILRKIYLTGPVGVSRLKTVYGGKKRRGHKPAKHRKSGGKFIRLMLQQLENAELIKKTDKPRYGRIITIKGQKLIENICKDLK